ncbi:MAG: transcriptional repressor LexA [Ignavibacteriales bacterium]|nr:MAG: repressor LexA [Ignavibacteriaceae bacterium]MBW7871833.1 repressor LexA [Ignavibacteria bacterium]MCZ2144317.1 transcriptional repressor LexA [Ignavibacteriales bacterium]OQY75982.1 MAG: repressor LexA [Ignavibacteriales bacterium UTCHB3]MBV6446270.1 LexA repressor [Ignavibacteriaceae bacterium]
MTRNLTETQQKILQYLIDFKEEKGRPPSLSEIAAEFGYKNRSTVREHLMALEKKGMIKRDEKIARGIELLLEENMFVTRPIIGEAAAGSPVTIYPGAIDTVDLPNMIRMPKESFLLKVKGNSLKDAYIFNGDVIIVNPNSEPINGRIIAAVLDDGAVVKRYFKKGKKIELVSENPEFAPIVIEETHPNFHVVGVVVGVYRSMDAKTGRYS